MQTHIALIFNIVSVKVTILTKAIHMLSRLTPRNNYNIFFPLCLDFSSM